MKTIPLALLALGMLIGTASAQSGQCPPGQMRVNQFGTNSSECKETHQPSGPLNIQNSGGFNPTTGTMHRQRPIIDDYPATPQTSSTPATYGSPLRAHAEATANYLGRVRLMVAKGNGSVATIDPAELIRLWAEGAELYAQAERLGERAEPEAGRLLAASAALLDLEALRPLAGMHARFIKDRQKTN